MKYRRTAFFRAFTQRVVVIPYRHFGAAYRSHLHGSRPTEDGETTVCHIQSFDRLYGFLTLEDGIDRLSRNIREELPLLAA